MESLVKYRCAKLEHRRTSEDPWDKLTIHEREWAYCPFDARAGHHEWVPTGGVPFEELRRSRPPAVLRERD